MNVTIENFSEYANYSIMNYDIVIEYDGATIRYTVDSRSSLINDHLIKINKRFSNVFARSLSDEEKKQILKCVSDNVQIQKFALRIIRITNKSYDTKVRDILSIKRKYTRVRILSIQGKNVNEVTVNYVYDGKLGSVDYRTKRLLNDAFVVVDNILESISKVELKTSYNDFFIHYDDETYESLFSVLHEFITSSKFREKYILSNNRVMPPGQFKRLYKMCEISR